MTKTTTTEFANIVSNIDNAPLVALDQIMTALRAPETGCPWDLEQDFKSIAPYTIEEAYEVADAIDRENIEDLKSELGDLLFQIVFHSKIAQETSAFDFDDVARAIAEKMIRRHPHVFGDGVERTADEQTKSWELQKANERAGRGEKGILDGIPVGLPAMTRAVKLQKRAANVGFDWSNIADVLAKITEETSELMEAIQMGQQDCVEDEFGDLLFAMANLSRHLKVDPEKAVRRTNQKFIRRFGYIEEQLRHRGTTPSDAPLDEMETLWNGAKDLETR